MAIACSGAQEPFLDGAGLPCADGGNAHIYERSVAIKTVSTGHTTSRTAPMRSCCSGSMRACYLTLEATLVEKCVLKCGLSVVVLFQEVVFQYHR